MWGEEGLPKQDTKPNIHEKKTDIFDYVKKYDLYTNINKRQKIGKMCKIEG